MSQGNGKQPISKCVDTVNNRLKVDGSAVNQPTFPAMLISTLNAWNSSSLLNATQTIFTTSGAEAVVVQLDQTTTLSAGAITFEWTFDGTNWSTLPANAVVDPTSTTFAQIAIPYTVQASTNKAFLLLMNGAQGLRIRLSTAITGSGTVTPYVALLPFDPFPSTLALSPTAANFLATVTMAGQTSTDAAVVTDANGSVPAYLRGLVKLIAAVITSNRIQVDALIRGGAGATPGKVVSAASTNATSVKGSAGTLTMLTASNINAAARYLKIYDKASSPTVGTDTPKYTFLIPGNTAGAGTNIPIPSMGIAFSNGIALAITTGVGDSDTGAVAANDIVVNYAYL